MIPTVAYFVFLGASILGANGPQPQIFQVNKPFPTKAACEAHMIEVALSALLPESATVLGVMCGRVNSANELSI